MWKLIGIIFLNFTVALSAKNDTFKIPDIAEIFRKGPIGDLSEECEKALEKFSEGITQSEAWALIMLDSITKFPDGVLKGHLDIPGHFDECVQVTQDSFTGKYCTMNLKLLTSPTVIQNIFSDNDRKGLMFNYGICIPSACSASEIEKLIKSVEQLNDIMKVQISESDCATNEYRSFRTEDWVTVSVICFFIILAIGSTVYDLYQRFKMKNDNPNQLWSSFSIYSNGKQIFQISQSAAQMKCLHGIRFFSMCWVILCHAYFGYLMGAPMNKLDISRFMTDNSFVPVSNGFVSVDSFFFLSGLLVCLVFFREIGKKGSFDVPVAFIHRYMRLTPPFALLMLIQGTIISRIGNGPFWNRSTDLLEDTCRESWWTGLMYLQNFLKPRALCLGQSWYLSADMQMYWVSPLILYPLLLFPAFAPYILLLAILAASLTDFSISFVNKLAPNLFMDMTLESDDAVFLKQFELEYVTFHTRIAPWLVGLATGYIICGIQAKKIKFKLSKSWVIIGWMAAGALLGGSLFGIIRFKTSEYTTVESALYLAFHKVGWALGLSWIVLACVGGYGGIINDFLSLDIFQPLAKLSYCNFLVHMLLQGYKLNSSRINPYLRHFDIVYGFFGDLLISNIISIPVALLFEVPFSKIDRHFFQKLVILPLPTPKDKAKKEVLEEKLEKPNTTSKDEKTGKVNLAFTESETK